MEINNVMTKILFLYIKAVYRFVILYDLRIAIIPKMQFTSKTGSK